MFGMSSGLPSKHRFNAWIVKVATLEICFRNWVSCASNTYNAAWHSTALVSCASYTYAVDIVRERYNKVESHIANGFLVELMIESSTTPNLRQVCTVKKCVCAVLSETTVDITLLSSGGSQTLS